MIEPWTWNDDTLFDVLTYLDEKGYINRQGKDKIKKFQKDDKRRMRK